MNWQDFTFLGFGALSFVLACLAGLLGPNGKSEQVAGTRKERRP